MAEFIVVGLNPCCQRTIRTGRVTLGEVHRAEAVREDASGKGANVARVLAQNGERVALVGHVGGPFSAEFQRSLTTEGVRLHVLDDSAPIRACTTIVDDRRHLTTEFVAPSPRVGPHAAERLFGVIDDYANRADTPVQLLICGSAAAGYPETVFPDLVRAGKRAGMTVYCDLAGAALNSVLPLAPEVVKVNLRELYEARFPSRNLSEHGDDEAAVAAIEPALRSLAQAGTLCVVTRGAKPTLWWHERLERAEPPAIEPLNTIGSGDAFLAGFAAARSTDTPLDQAIERGHTMAALNAGLLRPGSVRP